MFGETHLTMLLPYSCKTVFIVETQVGQCRFARRNEVVAVSVGKAGAGVPLVGAMADRLGLSAGYNDGG